MSYLKELRKPSKFEADVRGLRMHFLDHAYFGTAASFLVSRRVVSAELTSIHSLLCEKTNFYYEGRGDFALSSSVLHKCPFSGV